MSMTYMHLVETSIYATKPENVPLCRSGRAQGMLVVWSSIRLQPASLTGVRKSIKSLGFISFAICHAVQAG
jgi:hypothetical protein